MFQKMALVRFLSTREEGWEFDDDEQLWSSVQQLWRKRIRRIKNRVNNAIYPVPLHVLWAIKVMIFSVHFGGVKLPLHSYIVSRLPFEDSSIVPWIACVVLTMIAWLVILTTARLCLRLILSYKGWLNEGRGSVSLVTKLWFLSLKLLTRIRKPAVYSFQGSLPKLPVPSVKQTVHRYLQSVRPLMTDNQYARVQKLAQDFQSGVATKLQRYLLLKSWWSENYVTDWWEEFAYLRSRSPLPVNSNFYGFDCLRENTRSQAARAATIIYLSLQVRRRVERQQLDPIMVQGLIPICMTQIERLFNTTRVPGDEVDKIVHYTYSRHVVVYHKGRYYKVLVYHKNRLLRPSEIEIQMKHILQDDSAPQVGEERLAALTAGPRATWARTRREFFNQGVNQASLDTVERAAFFVALDDFPYEYHELQNDDKVTEYGRSMFHGKGYDRWFDKSFNLCFGTDGRMGSNTEHSWADGGIMSLFFEYFVMEETLDAWYTPEGHCLGSAEFNPPLPTRLRWDLHPPAITAIDQSYQVAVALIEDLDLRIHIYREYGKGFVKTCKVSPDAYFQMALQLAYYRDVGKFGLTYESGTTRLYLEGRTETVRPCTEYSVNWVHAMQDPTVPVQEKVEALRKACHHHQRLYQDVMCGRGVDRHLFSLFVVSRYLQEDSPFLKEVLSEPWMLSTSQTPHGQTPRGNVSIRKNPGVICGGGGFGPAAEDGYGVSYIVGGDDMVFFHVTSKRSSTVTDTSRFLNHLLQVLADMRKLFEEWNTLQKK